MVEPQAKKAKVAVAANEVISFNLLTSTPDGPAIEENGVFPPEMTHQLFGDEEEITGYDGLSIDIFVSPRLQPLVDVKYASRNPGATDLREPFSTVFATGFFDKKADFDEALRGEEPLQLEQLGEQVLTLDLGEGAQLIVTRANLSSASKEFKELHARAQPFLYFFVDAASAIDAEDPQWDVFMALEKTPDGVALLGFCTVYSFYAYPDRCRMRLSQILVLPPHQGRGVGTLLLRALSQQAEAANAVDVVFEDPSEGLQRIRDKLDLQRVLALDWMQDAALHSVSTVSATEPRGEAEDEIAAELVLPPELAARVQKELRITKQQVRRVWEGLLLLLGSQLPQQDRIEAAVESMILKRMQQQVAAAKRAAAAKVVRDTESGFVMMRLRQPKEGDALAPPVPGGAPVEGISAAQQEEAIEEAVEARMEELRALVASMAKKR